jgi:hypothetical protein
MDTDRIETSWYHFEKMSLGIYSAPKGVSMPALTVISGGFKDGTPFFFAENLQCNVSKIQDSRPQISYFLLFRGCAPHFFGISGSATGYPQPFQRQQTSLWLGKIFIECIKCSAHST